MPKKTWLTTLPIVMASLGCGDSTSTSPTGPPPSPPPQPPARLELTVYNAAYLTPGFGGATVVADIGLRETAGTGLAIGHARLDVFRPNGEFVERRRIGQGDIILAYGTNRIEGNGSFRDEIAFGVRTVIARGSRDWVLRFTVAYTDDIGTQEEVWEQWVLTRWDPL